ncbi:MAG: hypothetical protein IPK58_11060 [Acidobacteria bacterium]|nr:hypothetical protein [Acidobacteriota bacterium]
MYSSGGFANPAEFADGLDNGLDGVEQSIGFDPIIGYMPIPVYNEGIRIQPVTALGVARGLVDMLRVGRGLGQALYCEDIDGWQRAVNVAEDVTRGSALFATLAGPVAGKGGGRASPKSGGPTPGVHGNSANSLRPTWGYKLYDDQGNFLKNGITSNPIPESRYPKWYMGNKKMIIEDQFPNRRSALDWERGENMTNPGPLNRERYLKR